MSIENTLERIATALEKIASNTLSLSPQVTQVAVPPTTTAPAEMTLVQASAPEPTEDDIRNAVRAYMNIADKQKAIDLLIQFGAKKEKPMIKDVANKTGLLAEINKCLNSTK